MDTGCHVDDAGDKGGCKGREKGWEEQVEEQEGREVIGAELGFESVFCLPFKWVTDTFECQLLNIFRSREDGERLRTDLRC